MDVLVGTLYNSYAVGLGNRLDSSAHLCFEDFLCLL